MATVDKLQKWRLNKDLLTLEITRVRNDDGASLLEPVERGSHCGGWEQRKSSVELANLSFPSAG
jgi:hypothetical protein